MTLKMLSAFAFLGKQNWEANCAEIKQKKQTVKINAYSGYSFVRYSL